jgi:hypothetical protein
MLTRAIALAVLIGATCSAIFVMPAFVQTESALNLELPRNWGSWEVETEAPSKKETEILAEDTRFSKARCLRQRTEEMSYIFGTSPVDQVDLSIVLSGHDLANSIHRPERCMAAQGHRIRDSQKSSLDLPNGRQLPLTRLTSQRDVKFLGPDGEPVQITVNCITYYFFVGQEDLTADHTERTVIDIRDRVLDGEAQRWAYVLVSTIYQDQAEHEYGAPFLTLDLADEKARDLIARLAESNVDWTRVKP